MHHTLVILIEHPAFPLARLYYSNFYCPSRKSRVNCTQDFFEVLHGFIENHSRNLGVTPCGVGEKLLDCVQEFRFTVPYLALSNVGDVEPPCTQISVLPFLRKVSPVALS